MPGGGTTAQRLCRERGTAMIWISHDLSVVSSLADNIAVMYAGKVVEQGPAPQVLDRPTHPYTRGLIDSIPSRNRRGADLAQIPGMTPSLLNLPEGCAFRPRCGYATDACRAPQEMRHMRPGQSARCIHPLGLAEEATA